ncbi:MAG: MG2 domain-containing protein [Flavobacteriales bacterium]|nr:MG2 domain-containing protein [Flavobacteriales bacterium]MDW8432436.1 MG2 domain-containing protein [Flavobacteriales bacterium]
MFICLHPLDAQKNPPPGPDTWDRVEALLREGRPASALPLAERLLESAKKSGEPERVVKALFYVFRSKEDFTEDSYLEFLRLTDEEIRTAREPVRQILFSLKAQLLWTYYTQYQWQIAGRQKLDDTARSDPRFWDNSRFFSEIQLLLRRSLDNPDLLKSFPRARFEDILAGDRALFYIYPTLYDFLAWRALDFFIPLHTPVSKGSLPEILRNPEVWGPAEDFVRLPIGAPDPGSLPAQALYLLRELTAFHLRDADLNALTAVDLRRFEWLKTFGAMPRKPWLYKAALARLIAARPTTRHTAEAAFLLARWYQQEGGRWEPAFNKSLDSTAYYLYQAARVCQAAVKAFPGTPGGEKCKALLLQLNTPHLSLNLPRLLRPGQPSLAALSYKNTGHITLHIFKTSPEAYFQFQEGPNTYNRPAVLRFLSGLPSVHREEILLPADSLLHHHTTYLKIPSLEKGFYILAAAAGPGDYARNKQRDLCYMPVYCTDLVWASDVQNNLFRLRVWNSLTDKVQPGVQVKLFRHEYDYTQRKSRKILVAEGITNAEGQYLVSPDQGYGNDYSFELTWEGHILHSDHFYLRTWMPPQTPEARIQFFTDRSLYRPGQTLEFKGVATSGEPLPRTRLLPDYTAEVQLLDPNRRVVFSGTYTTGDWGSFWGSIPLPSKGLNGIYTLKAGTSTHSVRVEDYKLPRFEVTLKTAQSGGLLGEEVAVEGACRTLAGFALTGVPVQYRVTRRPVQRWPSLRGGWPLPVRGEGEEVASGRLMPDSSGAFRLRFKAEPDESNLADSAAVYEFLVQAECTDLTGETRAAEQRLYYSYSPFAISISGPSVCFKNRDNRLMFMLQSLNEETPECRVRLRVQKGLPTGRLPLPQALPKADVRLIPQAEFVRLFPHQRNAGETEDSLLLPGPVVMDTVLRISDSFLVTESHLKPFSEGVYFVELTTLPVKGKSQKTRRTLTLAENDRQSSYVFGPPLLAMPLQKRLDVGQSAQLIIGALNQAQVMVEQVTTPLGTGFLETRSFNANLARWEIPSQRSEPPGFKLIAYTCLKGHILQQEIQLEVADPQKILHLYWLDRPDTLEPGREYTFRFKAAFPDGAPAADAEVAAVMYDAALDKIYPTEWHFHFPTAPMPSIFSRVWNGENRHGICLQGEMAPEKFRNWEFPVLETFGFYLVPFDQNDDYDGYLDGVAARHGPGRLMLMESVTIRAGAGRVSSPKKREEAMMMNSAPEEYQKDGESQRSEDIPAGFEGDSGAPPKDPSALRSRFQESAFFMPSVITQKDGTGAIRFRTPDQITGWTLRLAAHTRTLATGTLMSQAYSRKMLMVNTFFPRFLREGDDVALTAKITNLSASDEEVRASLEIEDAENGGHLGRWSSPEALAVPPGISRQARFSFSVPSGVKSLRIQIRVQGCRAADGEEWLLPVVPSETFITESLPFFVKAGASQTFDFSRLSAWQNGQLPHIRPVRLTVEYTENPLWLVVQALPYMAEFPHECAEQLYARYFSYAVLRFLLQQQPVIQKTIEHWSKMQPEALASALEKNPALKNILLEETPWLQDANDETRRKRLLVSLAAAVLHQSEDETVAARLAERQQPDGGWAWFQGGPSSWYISQHILSGLGRMEQLGILPAGRHPLARRLPEAVRFVDRELREDYENLRPLLARADKNQRWLQPIHAHYLFTRSFFPHVDMHPKTQEARQFFLRRAREEWLQQNPYIQAMLAIAFHRLNEKDMALKILTSLRERAIRSNDYGMYWKGMMQGGFAWSEHPVEAMAMLMTAFRTMDAPEEDLSAMQLWLLRHKQTNRWPSTKATTEACLALLHASGRLASDSAPEGQVWVGAVALHEAPGDKEAGTGYRQFSWPAGQFPAGAGTLRAQGGSAPLSWGGVYFQYFTPLDKVEASGTRYLSVERQLWAQPAPGRPLQRIAPNQAWPVGTRVFVRLLITCSQPMDYVHISDRRSATMEPEDVLSAYRWQEGLGLYQSTRDAATHFFVEHMPRGTFVLEYPVRLTHAGLFSDGFAEAQCMYAPEFSARSASARLRVSE